MSRKSGHLMGTKNILEEQFFSMLKFLRVIYERKYSLSSQITTLVVVTSRIANLEMLGQ